MVESHLEKLNAELEPVRQSGSGPAGPKKTGQDRTKPDFCRIFFDFLPDFCRIDVKNKPDGFYRIFFDFFARLFVRFLPDICQFGIKNEPDGFYRTFFSIFLPDSCWIFAGLTSKMIRPDFDRTGPDKF
jgi:hypothetical protein